ncbi:hypothetical protein KQQSB11_90114 [Klebsiella quasipneumoniae subsp. quasipneumoniae]|nr:hypothetical protein KQQSB11_90114 [Klebsiella quasipneumoniae subsp. quasipneumoniae]
MRKRFIDHSFTKFSFRSTDLPHLKAKKTLNAKTSKNAIIRYFNIRHLCLRMGTFYGSSRDYSRSP